MQLSDQFQTRTVELVKPVQFCNAVDKNREGINDPTAHLTCYKVRKPSSIRRQVISTDQFGELQLNVQKRRNQLCVPSQEIGEPSALNLDHLKLYRAKRTPGTPKFQRLDVNLADQFLEGIVAVTLQKPVRLGVPTDKNGEGITDADAHLTCYSLKAQKFNKRDVDVVNQFGQFKLTVKKPNMLCVPSDKQVVSGTPTLTLITTPTAMPTAE